MGQISMAKATKTRKITEPEFVLAINEEYARAKKILHPLFKGLNRSFIKFYWHKENRYGGTCWRAYKQITANEKFLKRDKTGDWTMEQFRLMIRHELAHLVDTNSRTSHGPRFLHYLQELAGHRYVGAPVYEGRKPKK